MTSKQRKNEEEEWISKWKLVKFEDIKVKHFITWGTGRFKLINLLFNKSIKMTMNWGISNLQTLQDWFVSNIYSSRSVDHFVDLLQLQNLSSRCCWESVNPILIYVDIYGRDQPLFRIINNSISTGTFSSDCKETTVMPILKKGSPTLLRYCFHFNLNHMRFLCTDES